MAINLENFEFIKARGEELYKSFEPVKCPYFNELVHFNATGLEHLKFKRRFCERSPEDLYMRFKLLHIAPQVLKLSRTVQGIFWTKGFERLRQQGKTQFVVQDVVYNEFIAVIEQYRVKVIVKRIGSEPPIFWSIIPCWRVDKKRERILYAGNPTED